MIANMLWVMLDDLDGTSVREQASWIWLGAPALLLLVGWTARRNLTVVLGWVLLAAVEITLIVLAILVSA